MKRAFVFALVMLTSLACFAVSKIEFKSKVYDFGEMESGKVKNFAYSFSNKGDSLLQIQNVSTSCGCAVPTLKKKEFRPGESGEIPVRFSSRTYNGRISKYITVRTNDPKNASVRLKLTGNVILKDFSKPELSVERIEFKGARVGKKYTKKLEIKNSGTTELRIIEVTHSPDLIPEFHAKDIKPKGSAKLEITFKPMQSGNYSKWLRIRTNSVVKRNAMIRVETEVKE